MTHKIDGGPPAARTTEVLSSSAATRAGGERSQPIGATVAADTVRLTGEAEVLQALERKLGSAPAQFDEAKVNALRSAIADGSYRIDAQQIATRLLDFERALEK